MREPRLEVQVDTQAPLLARIRKRLAFALGVMVGMAVVAGAIGLVARHDPPAERIVVVTEVATPAPPEPAPVPVPAPPPAVEDPLRCPVITGEDRAIGVAVKQLALHISNEDAVRPGEVQIVAAAAAPVIAYLHRAANRAMVSDDDGRSFSRVFYDPDDHRDIETIAMDAAGVLYALSRPQIGVREPGKRERWYDGPFGDCMKTEGCVDQIALAGDRVVWIHDAAIATSANHGRTWRHVLADTSWEPVYNDAPSTVFSWRGAVYRVDHYWDRCGVDDFPTWRFDGKTLDHHIFHLHYDSGDSALVASDDAAFTWTWRRRCRDGDYAFTKACPAPEPRERTMLEAYTLLPAEGARTLAVFEGGLVELCPGGARLLHRRYPFKRVAAVDWRGRPLQFRDDRIYRWSPVHGWRRLTEWTDWTEALRGD